MAYVPAYLRNLDQATYGMWSAPDPAVWPDGSVHPGEGGVDVGNPGGTPVYAVADGPLIDMGCWKDAGHCVITQRVQVPGVGPANMYFQHIQFAPGLSTGQMLTRGQLIGYVNGTVGGIAYNEVEIGFNSLWGHPWGTNPPGPWVKDPRPWIKALMGGPGSAPTNTPGGGSTPGTPPGGCGVDPLCYLTSWWTATAAPTLKVWGEYVAIFLIAVTLIIVGFFLLNQQAVTSLAKKVV